MSLLRDKRLMIAEKLNKLKAERESMIQFKVDAYRRQLEAESESEEILKLEEVLKAIDAVIDYDNESMNEKAIEPIIEQPKAEQVEADIITNVEDVKSEDIVVNNVEDITESAKIIAEIPVENKEVVVNEQVNNIEMKTVEQFQQPESRPGMAYVGIPERR